MAFLSNMERNSISSRHAYQNGLIHFHRFLLQKYPDYNLEMILKPLAKNKVNPYELLNDFVSHLQSLNLASFKYQTLCCNYKVIFCILRYRCHTFKVQTKSKNAKGVLLRCQHCLHGWKYTWQKPIFYAVHPL